MDPFIGEIRLFAGNYAPTGWALCAGQLIAIQTNTALFSLLGTYYGGDGRTTFALPNFEGRAPMHQGSGPGLTPRTLGETSGDPTVTLTTDQIPTHTHQLQASGDDVNLASPINASAGLAPTPAYRTDIDSTMSSAALATVGGGGPHNNEQPYLGLTYIIALQGIYPPRS